MDLFWFTKKKHRNWCDFDHTHQTPVTQQIVESGRPGQTTQFLATIQSNSSHSVDVRIPENETKKKTRLKNNGMNESRTQSVHVS